MFEEIVMQHDRISNGRMTSIHMHILEAYHGRSRYLLQAYSNRRIWPADIAPVRVLADLAFSYSEPLFGGNFRGMFGQKLDHTIGIPPAPLAAELYVYIPRYVLNLVCTRV